MKLKDRIGMWLRNSRIRPIQEALKLANEAGLSITATQLEAHQLAGGNPIKIIESFALAKKNDIQVDWDTLSAYDLAGKDVLKVVNDCLETQQHQFDTYSPTGEEKIIGWLQDRTKVKASCSLIYQLPVHHAFGWSIDLIQERLGARMAVLINTSTDFHSLELAKPQHEAQLLVLAKDLADSVSKVNIEYSRQ